MREIVIGGPIDRGDVVELCDRVNLLLRLGTDLVVCDVGALDRADAATVEALARLQLAARRSGGRMLIRDACGELRELLGLFGLDDVLPCCEDSGIKARRQPEKREQALRVEEEADPGDPPA